ncbi:uncharacterized protein LOC143282492 [Babylonia areolata]|uniref:uncharacterized protein LOC143282492 n=1 Tax=Babylonia areolata TaxID=304850 RepID=UPI003FCF0868
MGTSTGSTGRPTRRSKVWSHNTSYTGAAGVHSETGKKADVIQQSGQLQLGSSVSGLAALHQKEMRSLHQEIRSLHRHRRSLESSMVAYTERMRRSPQRGGSWL